jgi:hypothetical protein
MFITFQLRLQPNLSKSICETCDVLLQDFVDFYHSSLDIQTRIESFEDTLNPQVLLERCDAEYLIDVVTDHGLSDVVIYPKPEPLDANLWDHEVSIESLNCDPPGKYEDFSDFSDYSLESLNFKDAIKQAKKAKKVGKAQSEPKDLCFHCGKLFLPPTYVRHVS